MTRGGGAASDAAHGAASDAAPRSAPSEPEPFWISLAAGSCGGAMAVLVGYPMDTAKVRLQSGATFSQGLLAAPLSGVAAQMCGVVPFWACYYFGYKLGRRIFPDEDSLLQGVAAGAVAGVVSTPSVMAAEGIKTLAQVQHKSSLDVLRLLLRGMGARQVLGRLGSLLPVTLAYMIPSQAVFFSAMEVSRAATGSPFLSGGFAGMCEWSSALPLDTVRPRCYVAVLGSGAQGGLQGTVAVAGELWRTRGAAGFYKGLTPALIRSFPANAAAFAGIDFATHGLNRATGREVGRA